MVLDFMEMERTVQVRCVLASCVKCCLAHCFEAMVNLMVTKELHKVFSIVSSLFSGLYAFTVNG